MDINWHQFEFEYGQARREDIGDMDINWHQFGNEFEQARREEMPGSFVWIAFLKHVINACQDTPTQDQVNMNA